MTSVSPQLSGLARWRERQAAEKRLRMQALAEHRKEATVEIRDGREYVVLHLPDRYQFTKKEAA